MYQIEIEIGTQATDSNRILGVNKYAKHAVFERVKREMALLIRGRAPEKPLENFKISVTRYGSRALDYDNFIASLKPFIDSLTLNGVIIDDSWRYLKQINTDQKISAEKKLVIRVEELPSIEGKGEIELGLDTMKVTRG